jgi:DoxX-like family
MFSLTVIVTVVLAVAAIGSGIGKIVKHPKVLESFDHLGVPRSWLIPLAGCELAGAAGVLIGLVVGPLGLAAGVGLVLYFSGAVATHIRAKDKNYLPPAVLAVLAIASVILRSATL